MALLYTTRNWYRGNEPYFQRVFVSMLSDCYTYNKGRMKRSSFLWFVAKKYAIEKYTSSHGTTNEVGRYGSC